MPVLYCVRHGETEFNVEGRLQGRRDTALNPRGRRQAATCGDLLRDLFVREARRAEDLSYVSSPLRRARHTMEILRATLRLEPTDYAVDDRLMEISYGEWEGLTLPEIDVRMPGMLAKRARDKWDFAAPGGESYRELTRRTGEWYAAVTRDTVMAGHGGGIRALMALFDVVPQSEATRVPIAQGVVYVFANGTMSRYG
jgi:probable phosphoglycerate mutase